MPLMFLGLYVDHRTSGPSAIAQYSEKIKSMADDLAASGVLLVPTCSRVEFYGEAPALRNIPSEVFADFDFRRIEGEHEIAQRVAEIASGVRSPILGERNIIQQLEGAYKRLDPNLPIARIARLGIDIGLTVRERHLFNASFTYDQFVRDIMADQYQNGEPLDHLYLTGASDLCVDLIKSGVGELFRSTTMVTRDPKNARKRLRRVTDKKVEFMRPEEFGHAREPSSFVVITNSNLDDEYKAVLQNGILRMEPRTVVDLMANPVMSDALVGKSNYVNMYDEEFLRSIEQNNEQLDPKVPLVCSDIEAAL
ncbi:hypothetical protein [Methylobacterium nodulans]|uniref:Glutamyl-tRNA reductase N-terminal domain-containing protein n=1 Tax=Methylobacterium nodulans (strain LMG 21967 / CNCM I-2342 / ORS 2060) TaxID=460265 RepID=B8IIJ5_METNO|nr:hypothetical protein [Methylobacterium nodulans]ACL59872.1 hypothetical protein Mnod_5023 [Methylobacterium nodulans ORS 2060]